MSMPLLAPFNLLKEKPVLFNGSFSRSYIPSERSGSEDDIAGTIVYILSRAGGYVKGIVCFLMEKNLWLFLLRIDCGSIFPF